MATMNFLSRFFKKEPDIVVDNSTNDVVTKVQKELYKQSKKNVDDWVNNYLANYVKEETERRKERNKEIALKNSVCPKCGGQQIVHKFIDKKNDVFKFNHCNDCGHEWEIEPLLDLNFDSEEHTMVIPHFLDYVALHLWTSKFDPYDVSCEYDSDEEWERETIKDIRKKFEHIINTFPLEVLYYFGHKWATSGCFLTEEIFGKDYHYSFYDNWSERYTGKFTEKMERLLEKIGVQKLSYYRRYEF